MIAKDSFILLECFFDVELEKFIQSKTIGQLSKQSRIKECKEQIIEFMQSRPNSSFIIKNMMKDNKLSTMSIIIHNIEERNDHTKRYTITISASCETFKVERPLGFIESENKENIKVEIDFEKSKL